MASNTSELFTDFHEYIDPITGKPEQALVSPYLATADQRADWLSRFQAVCSRGEALAEALQPLLDEEFDHAVEVPEKGGKMLFWHTKWGPKDGSDIGLAYKPDDTHTPDEIFDIALAPAHPSAHDLAVAEGMLNLVSQ